MTAPGDAAAERVEQLILLTERLTNLLRAEAEAFESRRPRAVLARADETGRLANIYRHESAAIRANPALVAGAPATRRRKLIQATTAFEAVLARHGRALRAAKTITEGVVHAIAEEVARQRNAVAGYGPGARRRFGDGSAITLNRRA